MPKSLAEAATHPCASSSTQGIYYISPSNDLI